MGDFFVYILKSSLCLAVFYLFYKTMLSRETFHKFNRIVLLSLFLISLILPFIEISFQKETAYSGFSLNLEALLAMVQPGEESVKSTNSWLFYLVIIYFVGFILSFVRVGISFLKMFSLLKSKSTRKEVIENEVILIIHKRDSAPFSWMRYIAISEKDYAESGREIITHELAHVSRKHSTDLLLAETIKIIHWFNPAAYLLKQELQNIHEYEADEAVINKGIDAKQYQLLLIKKAVGDRLYTMANSFNHSKLKNRITMISKKKSPKWAAVKVMFLLPLSMFAVAAFATEEASNVFDPVSEIKITDFIQKDTIKAKKHETVFVMNNKADSTHKITVSMVTSKVGDSLNVLVFIDGVEKDMDAIEKLDPKDIAEVRVLKNEKAMRQYGEKAKDGVIVVTTKVINVNSDKNVNSESKSGVVIIGTKQSDIKGDLSQMETTDREISISRIGSDTTIVKNTVIIRGKSSKVSDPLYVIDGKVMKDFVQDSLEADKIQSITVLKGEAAIKTYGDKGKNGVIVITLKNK